MFYGYPISQWLDLLEWVIMMIVMFTGIGILSWILANKTVHMNKTKNNYKSKKLEKKNYFIDVA